MIRMHVPSFLIDPAGWIIIVAGTVVTVWAIAFTLRAFVAPGEAAADHPKTLILKDDR